MAKPRPVSHEPDTSSAAALAQAELIAGTADAVIRVSAIHWDRQHPGERRIEFAGRLADVGERVRKLNLDGFNIYMVAQQTRPLPAEGYTVRNSDVTGVRCMYVDGDASDLPNEWHIEPTCILMHQETARWWAFWCVTDAALADLPDTIKRLARRYGGDPSVCNLARVVRLAGFDRWKDGKNYGPYELRRGSSEVQSVAWHKCLLPGFPERTKFHGRPDASDVIDVPRLRSLLALIEPFDRADWLRVMLAIRDGTVIDGKFQVLDEADKLAIFDEWASGDLWEKAL